jgi:hypothetical protein
MANITAIQHALNLAGFGPLVEDGVTGTNTKNAVIAFQTARGLHVDGVVGKDTLAALGLPLSTIAAAPLTPVPMTPIAGLWPSMTDHFTPFTQEFEGAGTNYLYTDSKGWVTTGIGNKVDDNGDPSPALILPWRHGITGPLASQDEIRAAWNAVKSAYPEIQSTAAKSLTDLRLDAQGMAAIVHTHLNGDHNLLQGYYPGMAAWPADAQMALHSIAWAWGPAFAQAKWGVDGVNFMAALNQLMPDFNAAAALMKSASTSEEARNTGIIPRDEANVQLWSNAADVLAKNADRSKFYFPNDVTVLAAGTAIAMLAWVGVGLGLIGYYKYKGVI